LERGAVDAGVSEIMFTGTSSVIEASRSIGERIVAGHITPDSWHVSDSGIIERRPGVTTERTDRHDGHLLTRPLAATKQEKLCLTDPEVLHFHPLGNEVSDALGGPRDIEWAIAEDTTWVLPARPGTASLPDSTAPPPTPASSATITGEPAGPGMGLPHEQVTV
jgi:pyruvate, water dikinase